LREMSLSASGAQRPPSWVGETLLGNRYKSAIVFGGAIASSPFFEQGLPQGAVAADVATGFGGIVIAISLIGLR
jgi:hypothetical protein